MKNNGFTLIELLAVIVILAIIALIAVPIILNIINNSKEESTKRSKELYLDAVEQAVARKNLENEFSPSICKVKSNGNLTCNEGDLKVEAEGTRPCSGTINFDANGNVVSETILYCDNIPAPKSFEEDDWTTIIANVKVGNLDKYEIGSTKEIELKGFSNRKFILRVANTSTPNECNEDGFSQTACGFVIEFADVITTRNMNTGKTNIGGWKNSRMRTYLNNTILNALPDEIKDNIIDTYVVSGHGSGDTDNFITTDKLYLLSTKEVWGKEGTKMVVKYDTAEEETRQLDYYKSKGVTTASSSGAIKKYNGSELIWWLRSAKNFPGGTTFWYVGTDGIWGNPKESNSSFGVSPAFRI